MIQIGIGIAVTLFQRVLSGTPVIPSFLLQEDSSFLLLEDGDKIKLEG